eukprot:2485783-Prymnesium_polylepis.1
MEEAKVVATVAAKVVARATVVEEEGGEGGEGGEGDEGDEGGDDEERQAVVSEDGATSASG